MALKVDKKNLEFVKNLAVKHKLVQHIDRAIGEGEFEWSFTHEPKIGDSAWHPSGDCTPSIHDLWLKAVDPLPPERFPAALYKTFMVGHLWHQYLQYIVRDRLEFCTPVAVERRGAKRWGEMEVALSDPVTGHGPEVAWGLWPTKDSDHSYEVPKPFHWATGAGDIAPCDVPGYGECVVDFKTQKSMDFRKRDLPDWCADKYEAQINIYMDFFDLERSLIVCINKDSPHDMKEYEYRRNEDLIEAVYTKWEIVSQCVAEGIEVPEGEDIELPLEGPVST